MKQLQKFRALIENIVEDDKLHALWLNSLSMMENAGARKISKYEDPIYTNLTELKHAAEEARHAYYLKKQISKIRGASCPSYAYEYLLAPTESHHYLNRLDVAACRYLKQELKLDARQLKHGAYLLVTYSIELRADMLYGVYQEVLTKQDSKVNVKSIIAEEEGHLAEMTKMLQTFHPDYKKLAHDVCKIENNLFVLWIDAIAQRINL